MPNDEQIEPTVLPLGEAAARLGISSDALRMRIKRGKARSFKRGRSVFVYMDQAAPAVEPYPAPSEHRPNKPAPPSPGPGPADPWAILVDSQKQEVARLAGEVERLNQRLDRQLDEAREMRQMLQREQVLRQQEQVLRQELQDMLERLVDRPALEPPAAETAPPGDAATSQVRPTPAQPAARQAAPEATPGVGGPAPEPEVEPEIPPQFAPEAAPEVSPEVPPGAEDLADMLKEIGQSLRDLETAPPARERDLEDERRAAARVMSRLFRGRTPRPPDN